MKTIMVGQCAPERLYQLNDPDAPLEIEIEAAAVKALSCCFPRYRCFVFTGSFEHDGQTYQPDLALVANDGSHWFVIEVELVSHSLYRHVLPQVTAFRYGTPKSDCATILKRELGVSHAVARNLVDHVPRSVVVIANKHDETWQTSLAAHYIQFAVVSVYRTAQGLEAVEFDGNLIVTSQNLGFGTYSATDRALRFSTRVELPEGDIRIEGPDGVAAIWNVTRDAKTAWVVKKAGTPSIADGSNVQLLKSHDGALVLKLPTAFADDSFGNY